MEETHENFPMRENVLTARKIQVLKLTFESLFLRFNFPTRYRLKCLLNHFRFEQSVQRYVFLKSVIIPHASI